MRTTNFLGLAINKTKQWLVATARTAKLVKLFKNDIVPPVDSDLQISHKIIISVIEVEAVANRIK